MNIITGTVLGIIKENRILLLKRKIHPYIGLWALPGGRLEYSEHVDEGALREAKEETSLESEFKRFCGVVSEHIITKGEVTDQFLLFLCHLEPRHTNHSESEEGELKWFEMDSIEGMKDSMVPSDYYMIKNMIQAEEGGLFISVIRNENGTYTQERFDKI
jgi:ADP-ribose pyrophosphatase YjhB (NUDIX family)